ncbi:MAG: prepilin-type N-terminal cleavage/methylation domain-containing protein [Patescibacteria group bacterium]
MWKNNRYGFTLIEILISIALIAVLSAGVISLIGRGPQQYSRDSRRKADLLAVQSAVELYRNDNGTYPACNGSAATCNLVNVSNLVSGGYINSLPVDPMAGSRIYRYTPKNASGAACAGTVANRCATYTLCASGEADTTNNNASCGGTGCSGSTNCTFVFANP